MKKRSGLVLILDIVVVALAAILFVGMFTFMQTCKMTEEGGWMVCHWAGMAIKGSSLVMLALAVINLFISQKGVKAGLAIALAAQAIYTVLIPRVLINTCMMEDMHCNSVTTPFTRVFGIVICIAAVFLACLNTKAMKTKEN
ncbi:MAG: DUF4418 family protein [Lachnospiraceae bacterium]|nr:DUF4418 family protein [Lachnospiraceae bacterium]